MDSEYFDQFTAFSSQVFPPILIILLIHLGPKCWQQYQLFIFGKVTTLNQANAQNRGKKRKTDEIIAYRFLLGCTLISLLMAVFWPLPNIYEELKIYPKSASFVFKRACHASSLDLCDVMSVASTRNIYQVYGPDALNCDWCSTSLDYKYFTTGPLLSSYLFFFIILGSSSKSR
jgi:hypothetical protein